MTTRGRDEPGGIFARHLDLSPLRQRGRGVVRCIFHEDGHASLSVDLDRGLFHCFGCGAEGGLKRFAELVGEKSRGLFRSPVAPRRDRLTPWRQAFAFGDFTRHAENLSDSLRREATMLDPARDETWDLLREAVAWETAAHVAVAVMDDLLAEMRRR